MKQGKRRMVFWVILIVALALVAYVRLAPSDPARWHRATGKTELGEHRSQGRFIWREAVAGDGRSRLAAIDSAATADPATQRFAGSIDEGQITYISRSKWMGFPDYTTVSLVGENPKVLEIHGRLRFGRSDLGVNANRVKRWLAAAEG